jgi:hypothetical protein
MSVIPFDDINYLNIFPFVGSAATIRVLSIENRGGQLRAGSYTFLVRYLDELGTPTNFFTSTVPVAIPVNPPGSGFLSAIGGEGETSTSRMLRLEISDIDVTYDRIQIAVIPQYSGVVGTPVLLSAVPITSATMQFIYAGTEPVIESSLEEVLINTASYRRAKTLTQVDGSLYMANMERHPEINYQKYANAIEVEAEPVLDSQAVLLTGESSYLAPLPLRAFYDQKGYKHSDVYALYISFLLNDGQETPAFHIPGRPPTTFEYEGNQYEETATIPSLAGPGGIQPPSGAWYQAISVPHPELGTGYWENKDEVYPFSTDWEIWDVNAEGEGVFTGQTLSGQHVRHHHMPDAEYVPHFSTDPEGFIPANAPRHIGLRFKNVKIPSELRDRIRSVRFHYAKRTLDNQKTVDQSFALATRVDDDIASSRVTNQGTNISGIAGQEGYVFHPFNTLRTRQNIEGISFLRAVGRVVNRSKSSLESNLNHEITQELMFDDFEFDVASNLRFRNVTGLTYIPSYGFEPDGASNALVRLEGTNMVHDFDNTNGEEKILIRMFRIGTEGQETPDILYELCQHMSNMYFDFDKQELIFTGYQESDIDRFDPTNGDADFQTDVVMGGDTFIYPWTSRHTQWFGETGFTGLFDRVTSNLRHSYVSSYAHPRFRLPGQHPWEQWWPGTTNALSHACIIWKDGRPNYTDKDGDVFPDNPIRYNTDYLMDSTYKPTTPFLKRRSRVVDLPTRIIRSRQDQITADIDLFRQFREDDFVDLPTNRGDIVKLSNVNNLLIPHLERSLFRTRGKEELSTGDFRAFLGSGDLFEVRPEELYETDLGYGGLQFLYSSVVTEYGYFFADQQARKVFHLTTEGLREISADGMEAFFEQALQFNFERDGLLVEDSASEFFTIEAAWDPVYKRYLLTKKDLKLVPQEGSPSPSPSLSAPAMLEFDGSAQLFRDPDNPDSFLSWDDDRYFEPDVFTISYSPELQAWISFHDYVPQMYFFNTKALYSSSNAVLHLHNQKSSRGRYYGQVYPSMLEFVDNREAKVAKTVASLFINSEVFNQQGHSQRDKTVTTIRIRNSYQDTGDLPVTFFINNGNARYANGFWRINQLRNLLNNSGELIAEREWHEKEWLSDRYHYVKLIYDNVDNNVLHIISAELNVKQSLR